MPFKRDVSDELSHQRISGHAREIMDYARDHTKVQTFRWCKAQGFTIRREILFPWLRDQPEYQLTVGAKRTHKATHPPKMIFPGSGAPKGFGMGGENIALVPTMQLKGPRWPVRRMDDFAAGEIDAIRARLAGRVTSAQVVGLLEWIAGRTHACRLR